jgi:hypothetical protein
MGTCPSGKLQRILASEALTDSRWAGRGTMNGFVLSFPAKIGLEYGCGILPKIGKMLSLRGKAERRQRHGDLDRER